MKRAQLAELMMEGAPIVVVEYRGTVADEIKYQDKKTGLAAVMQSLRHNVELGNLQISVKEYVPDGAKAKEIKVLFKKGQKLALHIKDLIQSKGFFSARGELELIEA